MQKLIYRNPNGEEVNLTSGDFGVTAWSGFDSTSLEVQSQQVPFHDGSVYLDSLLSERELSVTVAINDDNDLEKRYELRSYLISILNPKLGEGELIYENDYLKKRIVCVPHIPQFSNKNINTSGTVKAKIDFTASDPYWEDLEDNIVELTKGNVFIENNGNVPTSLRFNFSVESVEDLTVKNLTNDKKIKLNGTINDDIEINTGFGAKNVVSKILQLKSFEGLRFNDIAFSRKDSVFIGISDYAVLRSYNGLDWEVDYYNDIFKMLKRVIYSEHYKKFFTGGSYTGGGASNFFESSDGITWTQKISGPYNTYLIPIFSKDDIVFFKSEHSNNYVILSTSDFENYDEISYPINDICYANDLFVGVGNSGTIITSPDGVTWTERTSGVNNELNKICYANNLFVAVGANGTIITSPDGETWTQRTSGVEGLFPNTIKSVVYCSLFNLFVACGEFTKILTSPDGVTWSEIDFTDVGFSYKNCAYYCDELSFILVAGEASQIYTSNDGLDWISLRDASNDDFSYIIYDERKRQFISSGLGGIKTSPDGITWTKIYNDLTYDIACNENLYICVKEYWTQHFMISDDLINWRDIDVSSLVQFQETMKLYFSKLINKFISYGNKGTVLTSPDGITWTKVYSALFGLLDICESDDLIVCTGYKGGILSSSDGIIWTSRRYTMIDSEELPYCMYCKQHGKFITCYTYKMLMSSDGITWTQYNMVNMYGGSPINIIYHDFKNIYIGLQSGSLMMSLDGITWDRLYDTSKFETLIYNQHKNIVVLGGNTSSYGVLDYISDENLISYLTDDSDMSFNLEVGKNNLLISAIGNIRTRIQYRQKYLGV